MKHCRLFCNIGTKGTLMQTFRKMRDYNFGAIIELTFTATAFKAAQAEGKHEEPTPLRSASTRTSAIPTFAKVRAYPNTCFHKSNYFIKEVRN